MERRPQKAGPWDKYREPKVVTVKIRPEEAAVAVVGL